MSQSNMEKRVLALKYRPSRFEDLVGQSTVSQTLSLALDSNRLSHAYLLSGLRGSGKHQLQESWQKHFFVAKVQLQNHVKFVITAKVQTQIDILILLKWMRHQIVELMI